MINLLKCKNGAILLHDASTSTYWVIAPICGKATRLFAGADIEKANNTFKFYSRKGE